LAGGKGTMGINFVVTLTAKNPEDEELAEIASKVVANHLNIYADEIKREVEAIRLYGESRNN
jgi:hypothetical protein